jgi:crossover junction endodeoxyribonuclease RusA
VILTLPWPPSANRYYRTVNGRPILSAEARDYRELIRTMYNPEPLTGRLSVTITANPPDLRKRDLDNLLKQTLDALQHAGVYLDDAQIDYILIRRGIKSPPGNLEVEIDGYAGN